MPVLTEGGDMAASEQLHLLWQKASRSGTNGCLEVARLSEGEIGVRDSKHPERGRLRCSPAAWRTFLQASGNGEFDRLLEG